MTTQQPTNNPLDHAPLDVLAVMDALVESSARVAAGGTVTADPYTVEVAKRTRAAIAELIEVAEDARDSLSAANKAYSDGAIGILIERLSAALASVSGGAQ